MNDEAFHLGRRNWEKLEVTGVTPLKQGLEPMPLRQQTRPVKTRGRTRKMATAVAAAHAAAAVDHAALARILQESIPYVVQDEFHPVLYEALSGLHQYVGVHLSRLIVEQQQPRQQLAPAPAKENNTMAASTTTSTNVRQNGKKEDVATTTPSTVANSDIDGRRAATPADEWTIPPQLSKSIPTGTNASASANEKPGLESSTSSLNDAAIVTQSGEKKQQGKGVGWFGTAKNRLKEKANTEPKANVTTAATKDGTSAFQPAGQKSVQKSAQGTNVVEEPVQKKEEYAQPATANPTTKHEKLVQTTTTPSSKEEPEAQTPAPIERSSIDNNQQQQQQEQNVGRAENPRKKELHPPQSPRENPLKKEIHPPQSPSRPPQQANGTSPLTTTITETTTTLPVEVRLEQEKRQAAERHRRNVELQRKLSRAEWKVEDWAKKLKFLHNEERKLTLALGAQQQRPGSVAAANAAESLRQTVQQMATIQTQLLEQEAVVANIKAELLQQQESSSVPVLDDSHAQQQSAQAIEPEHKRRNETQRQLEMELEARKKAAAEQRRKELEEERQRARIEQKRLEEEKKRQFLDQKQRKLDLMNSAKVVPGCRSKRTTSGGGGGDDHDVSMLEKLSSQVDAFDHADLHRSSAHDRDANAKCHR
jgi:hypothetical protein